MRLRLLALAALVFVISPRQHQFRFMVKAPPELSGEAKRAQAALLRGLFQDSLVVAPTDSQRALLDWRRAPRGGSDSAYYENVPSTYLVRGDVAELNGQLEFRLEVLNILMVRVSGPDTVHVPRASVDSVMVELGRTYAQRLSKRRR